MNSSAFRSSLPAVTDVYTDLNGMAQLKAEKNQDEALKKVAQQFESMFVNMMMKSMRDANATFEEDSLFNSNETKFYRDMYDQQLSLSLASNKGIGIAESLYRQMSNAYGNVLEKEVPDKDLLPSENVTSAKFSSPQEFVSQLMPLFEKAANKIGVEPEILAAQAALETGWGEKISSDEKGSSFNLFNIKADSRWKGESVSVNTKEFRFGRFVQENSQFRKYSSFKESVDDFVNFLESNPRYKDALNSSQSGEEFVQKLQSAGYATDPQYASKITSVYNRIMSSDRQGGQL